MSLNFNRVSLDKIGKNAPLDQIMTEIGVTVSEIFIHSVRGGEGQVICRVIFACSIHKGGVRSQIDQ